MMRVVIGIDPGTKTGLAVWEKDSQKFLDIRTADIISAVDIVRDYQKRGVLVMLKFEDARQRTYFGKAGRERMKGVGSVERDCSIWEKFCKSNGIPYEAVHPRRIKTKTHVGYFNKVARWTKRTSEHGRDAAMMVLGL